MCLLSLITFTRYVEVEISESHHKCDETGSLTIALCVCVVVKLYGSEGIINIDGLGWDMSHFDVLS